MLTVAMRPRLTKNLVEEFPTLETPLGGRSWSHGDLRIDGRLGIGSVTPSRVDGPKLDWLNNKKPAICRVFRPMGGDGLEPPTSSL